MYSGSDRRKAVTALCLLVPAPSLGAFSAMILFPDSIVGVVLFALSKVWLFGFPVAWLFFVEKNKFSLSPVRRGGFGVGLLTGLLISAVIIGVYLGLGDRLIDSRFFVERLNSIGLGSPSAYICGGAYWILVNSVLEEYVWRWFCVKQCERLMPPVAAVLCSALFFTLHHIVAMSVYFGPVPVAICSAGVFIGGAIWSMMYIKYRSVWPGYLSHALVDLCVFGIGASILFGA